MVRYLGPRLKIVRRLGTSLPGLINTSSDLRRPYPPGQHGPTRRAKLSDYALRLREKQKVRFHYGISEKQLRKYIYNAAKGKGNPGMRLLVTLENRLDNLIFRSGATCTIPEARQMVRHGHVHVNGRKIDIPSYQTKKDDILSMNPKSKLKDKAISSMTSSGALTTRAHLDIKIDELNKNFSVKVIGMLEKDDIPLKVNEQLIVEYYSGL